MAFSLMNDPEQYRQASLDFATVPERAALAHTAPPSYRSVRPRSQFHTLTPSNRRLHDDLWQEYRLECDVREREGLPFVSLPEFAAMRDWTDRVDEPQALVRPAVADNGIEEQRRRVR